MAEPTVQARLVIDTSGIQQLAGGLPGVGGGGPTRGAGSFDAFSKTNKKGLGSVSKLLGKLGPISLGLGAIAGSVAVLAKASPRLQQTISIFSKAITLFFRPFGDFLATILRPMAIALLRFMVKFNQVVAPALARIGTGTGTGGGERVTPGGVLAETEILPLLSLDALFELLNIDLGALFDRWIANINAFFESNPIGMALSTTFNILTGDTETWIALIQTASEKASAFFSETVIPGFQNASAAFSTWMTNVTTGVANNASAFKTWLTVSMPGWVKGNVEAFRKWLVVDVGSFVGKAKSAFNDLFSAIASGIQRLIDKARSIAADIVSRAQSFASTIVAAVTGKQAGGFVRRSGLHNLEAGEFIVPSRSIPSTQGQGEGGFGGSVTIDAPITIEIGNIADNIDIDALSERISEHVQSQLRRSISFSGIRSGV